MKRMRVELLWLQEQIVVCLGTPGQLPDWTCRRFYGWQGLLFNIGLRAGGHKEGAGAGEDERGW